MANETLKESELWLDRGDEFVKSGDNEKALECYKKALEINPRAAFGYFKRGQLYMNLNRLQEALNDLNNAIMLNSNFSFAFFK